MNVSAFAATDIGLVRRTNEDAFVVATLDGGRWRGAEPETFDARAGVLLAVSDGMGGAKAGEVASALAIDVVRKAMVAASRADKLGTSHDRKRALVRAVERASLRIHEAGKKPGRQGMGATLTAVLVHGKEGLIAQVGDSRAYLLRGDKLRRMTRDQSYVQMLVDAGIMTTEEAERSPRRNIIMQVMGQKSVRAEVTELSLEKHDRLLLCTDGLTTVVDEDTLSAIARGPAPLDVVTKNLVALVRDGGAPDNVTVIAAEMTT